MVALISRSTVKRTARRQGQDVTGIIRIIRGWLGPTRALPPRIPDRVTYHQVSTSAGVRGEWLNWNGPGEERQDCCIYYLHGGGYFAGAPATHRNLTAALAATARMRIFSLDYRLAPENPFPAAVEDAVAGYRWLLDQGYNPERMVIGGDSAGGGLSLATILWLRDAGLPLPAGAFLLSPWTDLACTGNSLETNDASDHMLCAREVRRFSKVYYGEASPLDPLVSPLYANFDRFPPLCIYVSDTEVLFDDSIRLAERARHYGVDVDLRIRHNLIHAWPVMINFRLPESRQVIEEVATFVHKQLPARSQVAASA